MTALILLVTPDRSTLNISNLLATNVGAYMDPNKMSRGLYTVLSSIDILSFMLVGLLSLRVLKTYKGGFVSFGIAATGGLWLFYVSIKMALSLLF